MASYAIPIESDRPDVGTSPVPQFAKVHPDLPVRLDQADITVYLAPGTQTANIDDTPSVDTILVTTAD